MYKWYNICLVFINLFSLASLHQEGSSQNFQLVVITHDLDFVNMMGRSDHVDDYLRLKREG